MPSMLWRITWRGPAAFCTILPNMGLALDTRHHTSNHQFAGIYNTKRWAPRLIFMPSKIECHAAKDTMKYVAQVYQQYRPDNPQYHVILHQYSLTEIKYLCGKCQNINNVIELITIPPTPHGILFRCLSCYQEIYDAAERHFAQFCLAQMLPLIPDILRAIVNTPAFAAPIIPPMKTAAMTSPSSGVT